MLSRKFQYKSKSRQLTEKGTLNCKNVKKYLVIFNMEPVKLTIF